MEMMEIELRLIRTDGGSQPRAVLDELTIEEYARAMREGDSFPPLVVFYDGAGYWLADGFHRLGAMRSLKYKSVPADVRQGQLRDAILYGISANLKNALPLTQGDKRRAVLRLLSDSEWRDWSDREVARHCGVDHTTVGKLRKSSLVESTSEIVEKEDRRRYRNKYGDEAEMNVGRIGKGRSASEDEWDELRKKPATSRGAADAWVEEGDGEAACDSERGEPLDPQTEINEILRLAAGSKNDPLRLYARWREACHQAKERGEGISRYLFDKSEDEVDELIRQRITKNYPEQPAEEVAAEREALREREKARIAAELQRAQPYGTFKETLELFERVGLALVRHPDCQPHDERRIQRICQKILQVGFGEVPGDPEIIQISMLVGEALSPRPAAFSEQVKLIGQIIGNSKQMKCHLPGCPAVESISPNRRVPFRSLEEAKEAGYIAAGDCGIEFWSPAPEKGSPK